MQEDIVRLIELQKIDLEILKLEKSVAEVPQALKKAKKERDLLKEKVNVLEKAIEEKEKQKNLFEEELKEEQKRLKQTQARLTQIRGSRDYQILLREIDEMKKTIRIKEDEILKLMEEIENLSKERDNLKNQLEKVQAVLEEETKKFEKFCEEINAEKESLLKKRKEIAEKISGGVLRKYELIRQKKGGVGIAAVENGVCEGCFMSIPPQLYNELQKDNRFYECPHCKRIIYFKRIYHKEEEALPEES
ncbi:MAG: zinc ribbon domain-containing protein [Caldimicrobium sp.]|jgi:predicted  nucleic acid-binding Zn-ribbon protein